MRGGARTGAGRHAGSPDLLRDRVIRVSVTDAEYTVIALLAEQWDVPVATAAYGLLADQIANCRKEKALAMPEGLIYAASRIVAKYEPELQEKAS